MRSNFNSLLVVLAILDIGVVVTGIWYTSQRYFLELETKAIRRFAKVSIVSYSRPSLMIMASASQFHVYLP